MNEVPQMNPTDYPDLFVYNDSNPTMSSPNAGYDISMAQTRETLEDIDFYKNFIKNAISQFRHSKLYRHYKAHLMSEIGINCCQYHSNIKSGEEEEMATIEMHHHILTIFDIAFIITEHVINSGGCITTFDLIKMLGIEHTEHRVATVMLCKTCHQLQHHDPSFFLPTNMVFGNWVEFLQRYQRGVSRDIYYKILHTLKKELTMYDPSEKRALQLLSIANTLEDWSAKNAYFFGESGINM